MNTTTLQAGNLLDDTKPFKMTKTGAKKAKELDINYMETYTIAWFLVKRHKFSLSILLNMALVALLVAQFLAHGV